MKCFLPKPPATFQILGAIILCGFIMITVWRRESVVNVKIETVSSIARCKDSILDGIVTSLIIQGKPLSRNIRKKFNHYQTFTFDILPCRYVHPNLPLQSQAKSFWQCRLLGCIQFAIQAKTLFSAKYRKVINFKTKSMTYITKATFIVKPLSVKTFNTSIASLNHSPAHSVRVKMTVHIYRSPNRSFGHWIDQTIQPVYAVFRGT